LQKIFGLLYFSVEDIWANALARAKVLRAHHHILK